MPSPEQPSPAPVLGIAHGYGFEDSGSNIWTREIVRALARQGYTVHVVCQVARPEAYAFVSRAVAYDAHPPRVLLDRETVFPGTVTVHRPDLRVIPAFVRPRQPEGHVAYIPDLSGPDTEEYIERNARVLEHVACAHGVGVWSVNHVLLMALAAHRAQSRGGAPYTVLPHGSAIEYVVKQSARALEQASEGLRGAARIFSLSPEMDDRLHDVFGIDANRDPRLIRIPLGTDTSVFQPLARSERRATVEHLALQIEGEPQGRTGGATDALYARLAALPPLPSDAAVLTALETEPELAEVSGPDANLAARLRAVDWPAKTVLFVGRLIAAKGADALVAAFPLVAARFPDARLIVAGGGPLRNGLEALVWALAEGRGALFRQLVRLGSVLEGERDGHAEPFFGGQGFVDKLDASGAYEAYIQTAHGSMTPASVVFTGHLRHDTLRLIYGLADVAAFPSVVREAGPLVVLESAAAGVFPVGPDVGGAGYTLRSLSACLPEYVRSLLLIRPEAEHRVDDLAHNLSILLEAPRRYAAALRQEAETRFEWHAIASRLASELVRVHAEDDRLAGAGFTSTRRGPGVDPGTPPSTVSTMRPSSFSQLRMGTAALG